MIPAKIKFSLEDVSHEEYFPQVIYSSADGGEDKTAPAEVFNTYAQLLPVCCYCMHDSFMPVYTPLDLLSLFVALKLQNDI